jgi:hypothetical protein
MGLGFTFYLFRRKLFPVLLSFSLAPIVGSTLIILVGVFFLYYKINIFWYTVTLIGILNLSILLFFLTNSRSHFVKVPFLLNRKSPALAVLLFAIVVLIISVYLDTFRNGFLYHRLSPDTAAYLSSANHLFDGHNLSEITNPFTNEILLKTLRWGVPLLFSSVAKLCRVQPYEIIFITAYIIFFSGVVSLAILYSFLSEKKNRKSFVFLYSVFGVSNVAILNFLNEGFYPQVLGLIFINLVFALFLNLRMQKCKSIGMNFSIIVLLLLFFSGTLSVYSEAFILAIIFICSCFLFDFFHSRDMIPLDATILTTALISIIFVFPIGITFIKYTILNVGNMSNVGYPLPTWILPSDIIGLTNIFSKISFYLDEALAIHLVRRNLFEMLIVLPASVWVIYEIITALIKREDKSFFLTLIILPIMFFLINIYKFHTPGGYPPVNYFYNKMVTMFILSILGLFVLAINNGDAGISKINLKPILGIILVGISLSLFLRDSQKYKGFLDTGVLDTFTSRPELAEKYVYVSMPRGYRNGKIVGKYRYIDRTNDFIFASMIPGIKFMDQWSPTQWLSLPQDNEVVLIARKADLDGLVIKRFKKDRILAESRSYIFIRTNMTLRSIKDINSLISLLEQSYG